MLKFEGMYQQGKIVSRSGIVQLSLGKVGIWFLVSGLLLVNASVPALAGWENYIVNLVHFDLEGNCYQHPAIQFLSFNQLSRACQHLVEPKGNVSIEVSPSSSSSLAHWIGRHPTILPT